MADAVVERVGIFGPKEIHSIGTWNVRTLREEEQY